MQMWPKLDNNAKTPELKYLSFELNSCRKINRKMTARKIRAHCDVNDSEQQFFRIGSWTNLEFSAYISYRSFNSS